MLPSGKFTVRPWNSPIYSGFIGLPTPMNARVELLIYWRVLDMSHHEPSMLVSASLQSMWIQITGGRFG